MKPDRRTLLIGAAAIAAALPLIARQGTRPARAGGACCPLTPGWSLSVSNEAAESTNAKPGLTGNELITNHQR